jgi:hypothetical protein
MALKSPLEPFKLQLSTLERGWKQLVKLILNVGNHRVFAIAMKQNLCPPSLPHFCYLLMAMAPVFDCQARKKRVAGSNGLSICHQETINH